MELKKFAQTQASLVAGLVPALGAISLFWWSFTREFPDTIRPFASPTEAIHLLGGLLINVVAALFFSRFIRVFIHYNLTIARDLFFAKPRESADFQRFQRYSLRINVLRRFFRRRTFFIDVTLGVLLFSLFSFGELKFILLLTFAFWSAVFLIGLLGISFRVPIGSQSILPHLPSSISSDRVSKAKVSWAVMSLLLFALIFGGELREHRKKITACIHKDSVAVRASIILVTGDVVMGTSIFDRFRGHAALLMA